MGTASSIPKIPPNFDPARTRKIMLSKEGNEYFESLDIPKSINFVSATESIANAVIFDYYNIQDKTGLTVGDFFKLDSASNTGTYTIDGGTIANGTSSVSGVILNLTNGAVITANGSPANITINDVKSISITNIVANSRIRLYNVTTATEITNEIVTGTTFTDTYNEGGDYTAGDTIRMTLTYANGTNESKVNVLIPNCGTFVEIYCDGTHWVLNGTIISGTDAPVTYAQQ